MLMMEMDAMQPRLPENPMRDLLVLMAFLIGGFFVGNFLATVVGVMFTGFDVQAFQVALKNPTGNPGHRSMILAVQGINSLFTFVATPWFYAKMYELGTLRPYWGPTPRWQSMIVGVVMLLAFMPFIAWLVTWNEAVTLPSFLSGFEQWARTTEDTLKVLTEFMVRFESTWELLLGILVVSILPGIGEELMFRGLLQTKMQKLLGNPHVAIWTTALMFGAFHLQFYGVAPRMFLGALFGYLYYYSGSLAAPMAAHFVNNFLTLLVMYSMGSKESTELSDQVVAVGWWPALASVFAGGLILFYFRTIHGEKRNQRIAD